MTAPPEHPDADLLAWEAELECLVVEHAKLEAAWPKGETAVERARTGRRYEETLSRIAELHKLIAQVQPHTLAGAAQEFREVYEAVLGRFMPSSMGRLPEQCPLLMRWTAPTTGIAMCKVWLLPSPSC